MKHRTCLYCLIALGLFSLIISACSPAVLAAPETQPTQTDSHDQAAPPAADVALTDQDAGTTIHLTLGQSLVVSLEGNLTTGYTWEMLSVSNPVLEQTGEPVFTADSQALGSSGTITLVFKAINPGEQSLSLVYHRPFEKDVPPLKTYQVNVVVGNDPTILLDQSPATVLAVQPTQASVVPPRLGLSVQMNPNLSTEFSLRFPIEWKLKELVRFNGKRPGK